MCAHICILKVSSICRDYLPLISGIAELYVYNLEYIYGSMLSTGKADCNQTHYFLVKAKAIVWK